MFISEGRIVSTKGRNTPERVWDATPSTKFEGFPMVVLVNRIQCQCQRNCLGLFARSPPGGHCRRTHLGQRQRAKRHRTGRRQKRPEADHRHLHPAQRPQHSSFSRRQRNRRMGRKAQRRHGSPAFRRRNGGAGHRPPPARHGHRQTARRKAKADRWRSDEHADNSSAEKADKSTAPTDNASAKIAAKDKPAASIHPSKFADRQLQKAVEYLSTELARASEVACRRRASGSAAALLVLHSNTA